MESIRGGIRPTIAVACVLASVLVTVLYLPQRVGYLVSFAFLSLVLVIAVFTGVSFDTDRVFLVLFALYWVLLAGNYFVTETPTLLPYIVVTPVAVAATVVVLPQFIEDDRMVFAKLLVALGVVFTVIGVAMLVMETRTEEELFQYVGGDVMGFEGLRIASVFSYWNTYGFMMMVGTLSALYVYLEERGPAWAVCLGIALLGLALSEGDASYVGVIAGGFVLVTGYSLVAVLVFLILSLFGMGVMIWTGQLQELLASGLTGRVALWEASIRRLQDDPYFGIGFMEPAEEIAPYSDWPNRAGPHNSYIHILLNTGLIAGIVYLVALGYGTVRSFRTVSSNWDLYIAGTLTAILVHMVFESVTLGGLSMTSVFLGIFLGLGLK